MSTLDAAASAGIAASAEAAAAEGGTKRMSRREQKEAADAFSDRMNSTPAAGSEADAFREADDKFKQLGPTAIRALTCTPEAQLPPEAVAAMTCWCYLHGEPASVTKCMELANDCDDFRLVGMSSMEYLTDEEIS